MKIGSGKIGNRNPTVLRFCIACAVVMVVTGACLNTTWNAAGQYIRYSQMSTEKTIKLTDKAVKTYRQKKGVLPRSLSQLRNVADDAPMIREGGVIWDSWQHPVAYEVHGSDYLIVSYGRDGKRGGVGLDCDLSNVNLRPREAQLPFLQVLVHPLAQGMVWMSILSGVMAGLLTFSIMKPAEMNRQGSVGLAAKLVVTVAASLFMAVIITMLHVPSGH